MIRIVTEELELILRGCLWSVAIDRESVTVSVSGGCGGLRCGHFEKAQLLNQAGARVRLLVRPAGTAYFGNPLLDAKFQPFQPLILG